MVIGVGFELVLGGKEPGQDDEKSTTSTILELGTQSDNHLCWLRDAGAVSAC